MANALPADVARFLAANIDSVAKLEVLLLLRSDPRREWGAAEVGKQLYTSPDMVSGQLEELCIAEMLEKRERDGPCYRYAPRNEDLAGCADKLEAIYRERRVAVITQIYSGPVDKMRSFADAFRLRKEK